MRNELAALSFSDKVKILEKLRKRSLAFAEAREKRRAAIDVSDEASRDRPK
jgi:hypothetical protein